MSTLAIIAEYNPFHNGHAYQLQKAKQITGATHAITVMSGNFLQRGHVAMWDKYTRALMCVSAGLDAALELPFCYASGSAMDFAMGAVSMLNALHTVDYLCFGAETDDIKSFEWLSEIMIHEPEQYKMALKKNMASGYSFPVAREHAVMEYTNDPALISLLSSPNNILALEYLCALKRTHSDIKPVLIQRTGSGYHDSVLHGHISSATAIRGAFDEVSDDRTNILSRIEKDIPEEVISVIKDCFHKCAPVFTDDLTPFLQMKRISQNPSSYSEICDLTQEMSDRLCKLEANASFMECVNDLKTRNYTSTRICRALLHLLLGYTEADRSDFIHKNYIQYANILAFRRESSSVLKDMKSRSSVPLITKKADFKAIISQFDASNTWFSSDIADRMWKLDTAATELYNCMIYNRYHHKQPNDYTVQIPVL